VERRFRFAPFHARVFHPEVGVARPTPICHFAGVKELDSKFKPAHLAIFLEVTDQFVLQALRVIFFKVRAEN
jgi:hypothetical protein